MKFGIGQPVRRFEDIRLITGRGRYQDDIVLPRQTYAMFLRSPHAHARIVSIDVKAARAAPGVLAVHTGAAEGCKQAIRCGARSLEHAYLIDAEGIEMAERAGAYVVPTMQMTQEDLHQLQIGTLPCQAVWKFRRDSERILASQRLLAESQVKVAYVSRFL